MKLTIDDQALTVLIEGETNLGELIPKLQQMLPNWKDYKILTQTIRTTIVEKYVEPQGTFPFVPMPQPYIPDYDPYNPWKITCEPTIGDLPHTLGSITDNPKLADWLKSVMGNNTSGENIFYRQQMPDLSIVTLTKGEA